MWFLFLLISLIFPFKIQAENADISATIISNNPPTITFVTPTNGQTGVPADADIVVEISNSSYGVDINSVEIIINGVTYTAASPRVSITGDILDYIFTTTPYDPLFTNQANTVLVKASNLNNNSTQSSIVFNVPIITPTPTPTPTPTTTPTTTDTPTPTPTDTSTTNTPTPTPRITSYITSTPRLTSTPTPTSTYPNCPTCPVCSISPTSTPISTTPDVTPIPFVSTPDTVSPIITFVKPVSKGYLKTNQDFIIQVSDVNSGINKDTIKITFDKQVFTLANTQVSLTGNSQSFRVTLKNKFQLLPNTEYKISVSAFDLEQNGISKSIFFQVDKPFPYLFLLLIIPIGGLIWFIIFYLKHLKPSKKYQTIGHIFNSLTLEPIPFIKVDINHQKFISNIFGILSVDLKPGQYSINIHDSNFSFPSKNADQPLDYPQYYWGQPFDLNPDSIPFLDIALDPYKTKNIFYKISQLFLGKPGTITNPAGELLTGLKIALIETKIKTIITSRVVDNSGHYRFIVPHGRYKLVIFGTDTVIDTIDTRHKVFGFTVINKNYIIK